MWSFVQANWHKILVVILAGASAWKYFYQYIKPTIKPEKTGRAVSIVVPEDGCVITIKPLSKE